MQSQDGGFLFGGQPSMKAPPKRKGNSRYDSGASWAITSLNESPSEKEGK